MAGQPAKSNFYWVTSIFPLAGFIWLLGRVSSVAHGDEILFSTGWVDQLDVSLSFRIDGLSLLMGLLVLGVGSLILIYASGYMAGHPKIGRFFAILILFMVAMLGVVTADNIILLFVFWELTSISSYLLIGFNHESENSQKSALQALLVTGSGGLVLLAGLILLGISAGSWSLAEILKEGDLVRESGLYVAILVTILIGAFTKSAQFPFHFWLPNAMAAPTPVSAYLHSATMVKAGVYLLARLNPVLGGTPAWQTTLVVVGGLTGIIGGWIAWQRVDMKKIMAYTTISALGILVFLIGIGDKIGIKSAVLFLVVHSLYKGALFMTAGSVDHEAGTRDVNRLGNLWSKMPITFAAVLLATLSMAGFIPLIGFVGKELIYEATLESHFWPITVTVVAFFMNLFNVTAAFIIALRPFIEDPIEETEEDHQRHVHEGPWTLWLGPLTLGIIALGSYFVIETPFFSEELIGSAVSAVYGKPVEVHLHALPSSWFKAVPMLSIGTIIVGFGWYWIHREISQFAVRLTGPFQAYGPERGYFNFLDGILDFAAISTGWWQSGYLRRYLLFVLLTIVGLVGTPLFLYISYMEVNVDGIPLLYELIVSIVIIAAAFMVVNVKRRLAAIAALGVVGYGISLIFLYFNAPDLAMTQFSIETLTVIIFVLVFYKLPPFQSMTSNAGRIRDIIVSSFVGLIMYALVLVVTSVPYSTHISDYFAQYSYELAKGKNVVNVILVDFRGFDTMVEISVLAVAAIGVYALIRRAINSDND